MQSFEQHSDHVSATLVRNVSGIDIEETVSTPYLLSAEGAHSIVRKKSGFTFYGETTSQSYVIGDIEVLEGLDREVSLLTVVFNSYADHFPRDGSSVERLARRCVY